MAQSISSNAFRPTAPSSPEKAFMESAMMTGDIKTLLEGQDRNAQLHALAHIYGGPAKEEIASFARAYSQIREKWLQQNPRAEALHTVMCRKLADAIGLNSGQRSLIDYLSHSAIHDTTKRHIVRTVSAIRVCSELVQYEEFDHAWRCVTENDNAEEGFAATLNAAMADYVDALQGISKANAEAEFRGAVWTQLRDGLSTGLRETCQSVMDVDRKVLNVCGSVSSPQELLKALGHAWGGDSEPPFTFTYSFRQGMSAGLDGVEPSLFRAALRNHLVAALPAQFRDGYAAANRSETEAERKVAVLRLVKEWLDDPARWPQH